MPSTPPDYPRRLGSTRQADLLGELSQPMAAASRRRPGPNDRALGAFLGLALGDAMGASVEGLAVGSFKPITDFAGGVWTDDTSMALCLADSLVEQRAFHPRDVMDRFVRWMNEGENSATGAGRRMGVTTRMALFYYEATGEPFSGRTEPDKAGNGSIMRLAPVVTFAGPDFDVAIDLAQAQSRLTHGAPLAVWACSVLAAELHHYIYGDCGRSPRWWEGPTGPEADRLHDRRWRRLAAADIRSTGYAVDTLEAALWCVWKGRSFREALLLAVNLGGDADTVGAVAGQLAGARWGASRIPSAWIARLALADRIRSLDLELREASAAPYEAIPQNPPMRSRVRWLTDLISDAARRRTCTRWGCTTCGSVEFRDALTELAAAAVGSTDQGAIALEIARQLAEVPARPEFVAPLRYVILFLAGLGSSVSLDDELAPLFEFSAAGEQRRKMEAHSEYVRASNRARLASESARLAARTERKRAHEERKSRPRRQPPIVLAGETVTVLDVSQDERIIIGGWVYKVERTNEDPCILVTDDGERFQLSAGQPRPIQPAVRAQLGSSTATLVLRSTGPLAILRSSQATILARPAADFDLLVPLDGRLLARSKVVSARQGKVALGPFLQTEAMDEAIRYSARTRVRVLIHARSPGDRCPRSVTWEAVLAGIVKASEGGHPQGSRYLPGPALAQRGQQPAASGFYVEVFDLQKLRLPIPYPGLREPAQFRPAPDHLARRN